MKAFEQFNELGLIRRHSEWQIPLPPTAEQLEVEAMVHRPVPGRVVLGSVVEGVEVEFEAVDTGLWCRNHTGVMELDGGHGAVSGACLLYLLLTQAKEGRCTACKIIKLYLINHVIYVNIYMTRYVTPKC